MNHKKNKASLRKEALCFLFRCCSRIKNYIAWSDSAPKTGKPGALGVVLRVAVTAMHMMTNYAAWKTTVNRNRSNA